MVQEAFTIHCEPAVPCIQFYLRPHKGTRPRTLPVYFFYASGATKREVGRWARTIVSNIP